MNKILSGKMKKKAGERDGANDGANDGVNDGANEDFVVTDDGKYNTALKKLSNIMEGSLYNSDAMKAIEFYKAGDMVQYQSILSTLKGIALLDFLELAKQEGLEQEINSETIGQIDNPIVAKIYKNAMMMKRSIDEIGNQALEDMGDESIYMNEDTANFDTDEFYNDLDNSDNERENIVNDIKWFIQTNDIELDYAKQLGYDKDTGYLETVEIENYIDLALSEMTLDELSLEYDMLQNRYK